MARLRFVARVLELQLRLQYRTRWMGTTGNDLGCQGREEAHRRELRKRPGTRPNEYGEDVMDFEPSDDQRLLVESVSRMLSDTYSFAQRKGYMALPEGYSPAVWSQFAEQGLLGLPFAEEFGGFGGSAQEVMRVMQAFGRVLVLEPFFPTVVLAGTAINTAGSAEQKAALLPAIAEGSLKLAFAHGERQARYDLNDVVTTAKRNGSGWLLDGSKVVVSPGEAAGKDIVSAA